MHARALRRPRTDSSRLSWDIEDDAIAIADDLESFAIVEHAARNVATFHYLTRFDAGMRKRRPRDLQTARAERRVARKAIFITTYSERVAFALGGHAVVVPIAYPIPSEPVIPIAEPVAGIIADWGWPPNRYAFADLLEVWPAVRERVKDARLIVAGSGAGLLTPHGAEGVEMTGRVDAVSDFWARVAVLAFPCPPSSGPKVKVIEALAHGVPVVTTPAGVEGIQQVAGAEVTGLDRFGEVLSMLLDDPVRRVGLGATGRRAILATHGPQPAARARVRALEVAFGGASDTFRDG
jgi:glycosyltransferase involved in cell wall biosynthesis